MIRNIYVGHSRNFDYAKELYKPLRASKLNKAFNIVLPHEAPGEYFDSKFFLKKCDYMIADVSSQSTALGIEVGWAGIYGVKVIFIYKNGTVLSSSLKAVSETFIEYTDEKTMIDGIVECIEKVDEEIYW